VIGGAWNLKARNATGSRLALTIANGRTNLSSWILVLLSVLLVIPLVSLENSNVPHIGSVV